MLNIFSRACWPSVCLWRNVYLGLLHIFQLSFCSFVIELYELFVEINHLLVMFTIFFLRS